MKKWVLLPLAIRLISACHAQSKGVVVEKLSLDENPAFSRRCRNNFPRVDWVDDGAVLVVYRIPHCGRGSYPLEFAYTVLDMRGRTAASLDMDNETGLISAGPNGGAIEVNHKRSVVQVLDQHFAVLETINCKGRPDCIAFLSADRAGFAICGAPTKDDCRYFRGAASEEAKLEDFSDGFPGLDELNRPRRHASTTGQSERYSVGKDESWFFDRKGNVFRERASEGAVKLPSPTATSLESSCSATVSEEGQNRLLAHCRDQVEFGGEMPVYEHEWLVLYDVPSGTVLFKLDPGAGNSTERLSPDGKRIAVVRGGVFGGRSTVTLYYVP